MPAPRNKQLYVTDDVFWYLTTRTKALNGDQSTVDTGFCADQLADDILRQWCKVNLPELVKLREKRDALYQQQKDIDSEAVKLAAEQKEKE
jgi:hypothetical protein